MAGLTDQEIEVIAQRIAAGLTGGARPERHAMADPPPPAGEVGVFGALDEAVRAAATAFCQFDEMGLQKRRAIIASIRDAMREHGSALAREAHEETGLGRYEDKDPI